MVALACLYCVFDVVFSLCPHAVPRLKFGSLVDSNRAISDEESSMITQSMNTTDGPKVPLNGKTVLLPATKVCVMGKLSPALCLKLHKAAYCFAEMLAECQTACQKVYIGNLNLKIVIDEVRTMSYKHFHTELF